MSEYPKIKQMQSGQYLTYVKASYSMRGKAKDEVLRGWFQKKGWFHICQDPDFGIKVYTFPQLHINRAVEG